MDSVLANVKKFAFDLRFKKGFEDERFDINFNWCD